MIMNTSGKMHDYAFVWTIHLRHGKECISDRSSPTIIEPILGCH